MTSLYRLPGKGVGPLTRAAGERGNALILTVFLVAVGGVFALVVAGMGAGVVDDARTESAADAAALAAADSLALGQDAAEARIEAASFASANGARLVSCDCDDSPVTVEVERVGASGDTFVATARAEVSSTPVSSPPEVPRGRRP
ncbi:MAG: hypothetical protein M5U31_05765 [Acidimicrobiia bacterium]|nr:hypothetical protein [Acidimicrobiia bacterium]